MFAFLAIAAAGLTLILFFPGSVKTLPEQFLLIPQQNQQQRFVKKLLRAQAKAKVIDITVTNKQTVQKLADNYDVWQVNKQKNKYLVTAFLSPKELKQINYPYTINRQQTNQVKK